MEKTDNTVDDRKLVFGDIKPEVEAFDKLARDLFPRVSGDVGVGLEQRLAE
jgi:hypothetical protein